MIEGKMQPTGWPAKSAALPFRIAVAWSHKFWL
jgi:hypothetical protein